MKIASFKTPEFKINWLVVTPPMFKILHPVFTKLEDHQGFEFADTIGRLPESCGPVVSCRLSIEGVFGVYDGFASCSKDDLFSFGKGMKISLENAIIQAKEKNDYVDFKSLWEALLADGLIGPAIRLEKERNLLNETRTKIANLLSAISPR